MLLYNKLDPLRRAPVFRGIAATFDRVIGGIGPLSAARQLHMSSPSSDCCDGGHHILLDEQAATSFRAKLLSS